MVQTEPLFFRRRCGAKSLNSGSSLSLAKRTWQQQRHDAASLWSAMQKRRILYIEGEPRWEFKFIRRAEEDDPTVQLVSMLRTSENKIYRQGISDPSELADGFPVRAGGFLWLCRDHHRFGRCGLLHAAAAGTAARVCRPARRRRPFSGRPLLVERRRLGRIEPERAVADVSCLRDEITSIAIRRQWS